MLTMTLIVTAGCLVGACLDVYGEVELPPLYFMLGLVTATAAIVAVVQQR